MNGYEVVLQPILFGIVGLFVAVQLLRGFHRESEEVSGITIKRLRYTPNHTGRTLLYGLGGLIVAASILAVPAGHRAVIWEAGGISEVERNEGYSLVIPLIQVPQLIDVRVREMSTTDAEGKANAFVQSTELLEVTINATLQHQVEPDMADFVVRKLGSNYETSVIRPMLYDVVREVAGSADAPQFSSNIDDLAEEMESTLRAQLKPLGINVVHLNLVDAVFKDPFTQAVLDEEVAEREADEQENLIRAREAERTQRVISAEAAREEQRLAGLGEGERIAAVADALGFTPVEYLEWLGLTQWNGVLPSTVAGSDSGFLFNLDPSEPSEPRQDATTTTTTTTSTTVPEEDSSD